MEKVIAIILLIGIVGAAGFLILQQSGTFNNLNSGDTLCSDTNTPPLSFSVGSEISLSTVRANNTIQSCFVIYEDKVYRIPTSWICEHPGGRNEIESRCGQDVTFIFNQGQHGRAEENQLSTYYIGELAD
jgi:hypothetical protein